jgi:hypothetical protein
MKKSAIALGLIACAGLSGCVSVDTFPAPDGRSKAVSATCSGKMNSWADCFKAIAIECPNGYQVADRTSENHSGMTSNEYGTYATTNTSREVIAICK